MKACLALLALTPLVALADTWVYVADSGTTTTYVEADSLRVDSTGAVIAWVMLDFAGQSDGISSARELRKYVCSDWTYTSLALVRYGGPLGTGEVIGSSSVEYSKVEHVVPGSIGESAMDFACGLAAKKPDALRAAREERAKAKAVFAAEAAAQAVRNRAISRGANDGDSARAVLDAADAAEAYASTYEKVFKAEMDRTGSGTSKRVKK